jgi:hypothetical protein
MLPEQVQTNLGRFADFVGFVDAQVKWSLKPRLLANLFTREELRLIHEFGQHFADLQRKWSARIQNEVLPMLARGGEEVERLATELEGEYASFYPSNNLSQDLHTDHDGTVARLVHLYNVMLSRITLGSGWLDEFLRHVGVFLKSGHGTSGKVIVRISIGNSGYRDAIIKTEARLLAGDKKLRLPMQTATRPWETSETKGPSQFYVVSPRSFLVLEFLVDENLNAKADLDHLRNELHRGVKATLEVLGIDGATVAGQSFTATLQ